MKWTEEEIEEYKKKCLEAFQGKLGIRLLTDILHNMALHRSMSPMIMNDSL